MDLPTEYQVGINIEDDVGLSDEINELFGDEIDAMLNSLKEVNDDFLSEPCLFSEELYPIYDNVPKQSCSDDIPLNSKEWMVTDRKSKRKRPPLLFEFLLLLLTKPHYASYASYINQSQGIFLIRQPDKVADLWEKIKNRQSQQKMTYDKMARAVRWYYKSGTMKKTNARYTFQFSQTTLNDWMMNENNNFIMDCSTMS